MTISPALQSTLRNALKHEFVSRAEADRIYATATGGPVSATEARFIVETLARAERGGLKLTTAARRRDLRRPPSRLDRHLPNGGPTSGEPDPSVPASLAPRSKL